MRELRRPVCNPAPRALQIMNVRGGAREEVVRFRKRTTFKISSACWWLIYSVGCWSMLFSPLRESLPPSGWHDVSFKVSFNNEFYINVCTNIALICMCIHTSINRGTKNDQYILILLYSTDFCSSTRVWTLQSTEPWGERSQWLDGSPFFSNIPCLIFNSLSALAKYVQIILM